MDGESFISAIVDLFRAVLYDILGLFIPGASLILVLAQSSFESIHRLTDKLTAFDTGGRVTLFILASYVTGYAVQGFAANFWKFVILPVFNRGAELAAEEGMKGTSAAFAQVEKQLDGSELFRCFRRQAGEYCKVETPDKLSRNEVQNLAYSIAYDRADNAFTFSFRADLAVGLLFVFVVGFLLKLFEVRRLGWFEWGITLIVYLLLSVGFALRAWTYLSIRGRIIYSIGLAALAEYHRQDSRAK